MSDSLLDHLRSYTTCDIADALLRLGYGTGGHLPDLVPRTSSTTTIGPAYTVRWEKYTAGSKEQMKNYKGHYIDLVPRGSVLVSVEPPGGLSQSIFGGLMGSSLQVKQAAGALIYGRVRDLDELRANDLPIFSIGIGICAPNEIAYPSDVGTSISICPHPGESLQVTTGDIVMADVNGVVVIPQQEISAVLELLPKLVEQDERVKQAIMDGMTTTEAFKLRKI